MPSNYPMMRDKLPTRTVAINLSDTTNPLLRLKFNDIKKSPAETPDAYATYTFDNNGSDDSKWIMFINIGASSASYSQYQFSAAASGVSDPSAVDSSPTHTQVTTLGALVTAINALQDSDVGLWAGRLHAPADYSLDSDDFIDVAESRIPALFTDILFKDASEVLTSAYRLGNPADAFGQIKNGKFQVHSIQALVNSDSATDCDFKMSEDPDEGIATNEVELGYTRKVPDNTWTTLWDFTNNPIVLDGPILFEITSSVSMAVGAKVLISYKSAEE